MCPGCPVKEEGCLVCRVSPLRLRWAMESFQRSEHNEVVSVSAALQLVSRLEPRPAGSMLGPDSSTKNNGKGIARGGWRGRIQRLVTAPHLGQLKALRFSTERGSQLPDPPFNSVSCPLAPLHYVFRPRALPAKWYPGEGAAAWMGSRCNAANPFL